MGADSRIAQVFTDKGKLLLNGSCCEREYQMTLERVIKNYYSIIQEETLNMKKRTIVFVVLSISILLSLCGCGTASLETPFSQLLSHSDFNSIEKIYGSQRDFTRTGIALKSSYKWFDYNGNLTISFEEPFSKSGSLNEDYSNYTLDQAVWKYNAVDAAKARDAIYNQLEKAFKKHENVSTSHTETYIWDDTASDTYNRYQLSFEDGTDLRVYFTPSTSSAAAYWHNININ